MAMLLTKMSEAQLDRMILTAILTCSSMPDTVLQIYLSKCRRSTTSLASRFQKTCCLMRNLRNLQYMVIISMCT